MQFITNEDNTVMTLSAYKADVAVHFYNGDVSHIDLDGREFMPTEDILDGLHVMVFASRSFLTYETHTLKEILNEAESQYEGIVKESAATNRADARMSDSLSSPQSSGRI